MSDGKSGWSGQSGTSCTISPQKGNSAACTKGSGRAPREEKRNAMQLARHSAVINDHSFFVTRRRDGLPHIAASVDDDASVCSTSMSNSRMELGSSICPRSECNASSTTHPTTALTRPLPRRTHAFGGGTMRKKILTLPPTHSVLEETEEQIEMSDISKCVLQTCTITSGRGENVPSLSPVLRQKALLFTSDSEVFSSSL